MGFLGLFTRATRFWKASGDSWSNSGAVIIHRTFNVKGTCFKLRKRLQDRYLYTKSWLHERIVDNHHAFYHNWSLNNHFETASKQVIVRKSYRAIQWILLWRIGDYFLHIYSSLWDRFASKSRLGCRSNNLLCVAVQHLGYRLFSMLFCPVGNQKTEKPLHSRTKHALGSTLDQDNSLGV